MPKFLLIDGDGLVYRAAFAAEKTKYLVELCNEVQGGATYLHAETAKEADEHEGIVWKRKELEPEEKALTIYDVMLKDIEAHYGSEDFKTVVFLSPDLGNYREQLANRARYKGNRSDNPRPSHYRAVVSHALARGANLAVGQEADDELGIAATSTPGSIIVSIDKDLMQIPGRHYDFVKKEELNVTPKEGTKFFYQQVLSGDSVDNVPGIEGIGPVKAKKLLEKAESPLECWNIALKAYEAKYGEYSFDYALETARLVRVRTKPGEIWQPPSP